MNSANLYGNSPINEYELRSVRALIAYTAHTKAISEETVSEIVKTKFNALEITKLRRSDYDHAVHFLVDFEISEILN